MRRKVKRPVKPKAKVKIYMIDVPEIPGAKDRPLRRPARRTVPRTRRTQA